MHARKGVLGGLVHLTTVLAIPRLALEDAYARIERVGPANEVHLMPSPTPFEAVLPRLDPSFAHAVCRYDLRDEPLRVTIPLASDYMSVSFYTRHGMPFYALNDRAAGRQGLVRREPEGSAERAERSRDRSQGS